MNKLRVWLCLGLALAASAAAQTPPSPAIQDLFLRDDLALAKTPALYFVIFTKSRLISLRAGGLILREWKIAALHAWGTVPPLETLTLDKKSALNPPKRKEIVPTSDEDAPETKPAAKKEPAKKTEDEKKIAEQESQSFDLEALELKDMPARFTLYLSNGTTISVQPRVHKFLPRVASFRHTLSWYLWVPLRYLLSNLKKRPFGTMEITLDAKEDVQAIYWALADGSKGLVFPL